MLLCALASPLLCGLHPIDLLKSVPHWLRFSNHDIHSNIMLAPSQIDLFLQLKSHLPIDNEVDIMRALQVACPFLSIGL